MLVVLALLLWGHFVADRYLQPGWLSGYKRDPDPYERWRALLLHGSAHALMVALVTLNPFLAVVELFLHAGIDRLKARGWYGTVVDQSLHVVCKVLYVAILWRLHEVPWQA